MFFFTRNEARLVRRKRLLTIDSMVWLRLIDVEKNLDVYDRFLELIIDNSARLELHPSI